MTGDTLRRIREDLGYSIRDLAARWGVDKSTVHREEGKGQVRRLYADAIKYLHRNPEVLPAIPKRRQRTKKKPPTPDEREKKAPDS